MAFTLLDSGTVGFSDGNTGHTYAFPGGAASAGDLLVLPVSSDTVVSTPPGYSVAAADVHNIGAYLFFKVAAGGETGVVVTTSGNFPTELGFLRYSGATPTPFDVSAMAFNLVATNTTPAVSTPALAGTGELVIAAACLGGLGGGSPNTPVWSAGYTNRLDGQTPGTGGTDQHLFVSDRYDGSGVQSPSCTWTSNSNNQTILVAAFTPAAGVVAKTDSDSGTATDTATTTAVLTDADTATGADTAALTAAISGSDAAAGTETATLTAAALSADAATGAETATLTASALSADVATSADTAALTTTIASADAATGTETTAVTAALATADTGHATETATVTRPGAPGAITVTAGPPRSPWFAGQARPPRWTAAAPRSRWHVGDPLI